MRQHFVLLQLILVEAGHSIRHGAREAGQAMSTLAKGTLAPAPRRLYDYLHGSALFFYKHPQTLRKEIMSGFTVAVLQVPESVAFSFVAGIDPVIGLRSTVFMAIVAGALSSQPAMINGIAGAIVVILAELTGAGGKWIDRPEAQRENLAFLTMFFAGVFQLGIGLLGIARLSSLIPFTAMIGFRNGLAIIILISQLSAFKYCPNDEYSVCSREDTLKWMPLDEGTTWMVILEAVMAAATVWGAAKLKRFSRYVPPALVALVVVTSFEHGINRTLIDLPTRTVDETASVKGELVPPAFPRLPDDTPWGDVLTYAAILAFVGAIESILTGEAVAELLERPCTSFASTQESFAQGFGNIVSALFGGVGGDTMIGQSVVNVMNGARHRLSSVTSGIFMAIFIVAIPSVISLVPVACLCGILLIVVIKTFQWTSFLLIFQLGIADSIAIIGVTALAVTTNLAYAVGAGVVWRALVSAFASKALLDVETEDTVKVVAESEQNGANAPGAGGRAEPRPQNGDDDDAGIRNGMLPTSGLSLSQSVDSQVTGGSAHALVSSADTEIVQMGDMSMGADEGAASTAPADRPSTTREVPCRVYYISGPLFFASCSKFRNAFTPVQDPDYVEIDLSDSMVADYSAVAAIRAVCKRYYSLSKHVTVKGIGRRSRLQMRKHRKLREYTEADEIDQIKHLEDDAEGMEKLHLFQPQGDELHHPGHHITPDEVYFVLERAGVSVSEV